MNMKIKLVLAAFLVVILFAAFPVIMNIRAPVIIDAVSAASATPTPVPTLSPTSVPTPVSTPVSTPVPAPDPTAEPTPVTVPDPSQAPTPDPTAVQNANQSPPNNATSPSVSVNNSIIDSTLSGGSTADSNRTTGSSPLNGIASVSGSPPTAVSTASIFTGTDDNETLDLEDKGEETAKLLNAAKSNQALTTAFNGIFLQTAAVTAVIGAIHLVAVGVTVIGAALLVAVATVGIWVFLLGAVLAAAVGAILSILAIASIFFPKSKSN